MERVIEYSQKKRKIEVIPAMEKEFCVYMRRVGMDDDAIRKHISGMVEKEKNNFWVSIGYYYVGALAQSFRQSGYGISEYALENRFLVLEGNNNFIIQQLLSLYFGTWEQSIYTREQIEIRNRIKSEISRGVEFFEERAYNEDFLQKYIQAVKLYVKAGMTRKERILIQELPCIHNVKGQNLVYPLTINGQYSIGVVNPWPGDQSAEAEVLYRMQVAADDIGLDYVMLDNFSHILDKDTQKATNDYVDAEKLDFAITTHYDSEKTADTFYYHTLWNPPEIPLNLGDYDTRVTNNYLMNDDYLIYDFGGMSNHLRGILINKPRTLEGASKLTASFPESKILEPKLEDPTLFYCGMNWEKVVSHSNRHEGLFKLLDKTEKVKFYGPEKVDAWGGLRPWEGYKCYQYSIPFDGFSILKEINKCGICLVLSSDIHRRAGAATNRTYEACAAGAVIISDDNEFMQHYFKDAALFIDYNKNDPQDTFNQIMEKYQWIVEHKEDALTLARRAQEIFKKHFALDNQFLKVVNRHYERMRVIEKDLFAKNEDGKVLVSYIVNTLDIEMAKKNCSDIIRNIRNQYYSNIILGIVCDRRIGECLSEYLEQHIYEYELITTNLYDQKGCRQYTDGQAIGILRDVIPHEFWINAWSHEIWYYDHITTLVRMLQEDDVWCAYSGRQHKDKKGYARVDFFDKVHITTVFGMNQPDYLPVPGQMLFKKECHDSIPQYMLECLDGYEHYAYMGMIWIKGKRNIAFSKRMTCCWCAENIDERCSVLKAEYQIRYIRDILKYDLPDGGLNGSGVDRNLLRQYVATFPVRAWFKMRWEKMMLGLLTKWNLPANKRNQEKYEKYLDEFMEW